MRSLIIFLLFLLMIVDTANSQSQIRYGDVHAHVTFKNYYRKVRDNRMLYKGAFRGQISQMNWDQNAQPLRLDSFSFNSIWGKASNNQISHEMMASPKTPSGIVYACQYTMEKQATGTGKVPLSNLEIWKLLFTSKKKDPLYRPKTKNFIGKTQKRKNPERNIFAYFGAQPTLLPQIRTLFLPFFKTHVNIGVITAAAVTKLSPKDNKRIRNPSLTNFEELNAQDEYLSLQQETISGNDHSIILARDNAHLRQLYARMVGGEKMTILIKTIEGGHNFFGSENSSLEELYKETTTAKGITEITDNITAEKRKPHRLFCVSPGHLFWNKIVGHPRGLDIEFARSALALAMWDKGFEVADQKFGEGVISTVYPDQPVKVPRQGTNCVCYRGPKTITTTLGWEFINALLRYDDNKFGKRTFIDFRHLDANARVQLIEHIKKLNTEDPTHHIPIIVSHAAVSGKNQEQCLHTGSCPVYDNYLEYKDPERYYKEWIDNLPKDPAYYSCHCDRMGFREVAGLNLFLDKAGWFHPMSNNLFDEEIAAVYETDGIIGITLEERALGAGSVNYRKSPHAMRDWVARHATYHLRGGPKYLDSLEIAEPFVRNMFYMVEHSGHAGTLKSWQHIAIGSDLDGVMNVIDICPTIESMNGFFDFLKRNLDLYSVYMGKQTLMCGRAPDELLRLVFYENMEDFTLRYF